MNISIYTFFSIQKCYRKRKDFLLNFFDVVFKKASFFKEIYIQIGKEQLQFIFGTYFYMEHLYY